MISRCPVCSTRHDIPAADPAGAGTVVDCASCGHRWVEGSGNLAPVQRNDDPTLSQPIQKQPAVHPLVEAARRSQSEFRLQRRARRMRMAGWSVLAVLAAIPAMGALLFPEQVVAALPGAADLYDWTGRQVNVYGLEIRQVDLQHLVVDGHKVIAVKGELTNVSSWDRKIPALRFGLLSKDNAEVYHWVLDTEVRPLKPGESTSFVTRLASPPEAARNLQIRFAHADEIGSNAGP